MPITVLKTEVKVMKPGLSNRKAITISRGIIFPLFLLAILFSGCAHYLASQEPKDYIRESEKYYSLAIADYKGLIAKGKDAERLYLELGQLYYNHGDFEQAIETLKRAKGQDAAKLIAVSYYRTGDFTSALDTFNKQESADGEFQYYHGLTCEKLNLFDQALAAYAKIKGGKFKTKAEERVYAIEKQAGRMRIEDIDKEASRISSLPVSSEQYPQAGAVILLSDENIEITPEGRQITQMHYIVKILNQRGKESFAETGVEYDYTYERVELEYARTIKPDGTVVDVGGRHIRDVSRYLNFPLYSNARVYIISFPEVAEGSCLEYKLKIHRNQLINKKDFVTGYSVQASEPILAANLSISLPKARSLNIKILNERYNDFSAETKPKINEDGNRVIYNWRFKEIPQIIPEANMPPAVEINPSFIISTFGSWGDIYQWWQALARDKIKADAAIEEKVGQLVKGLESPEARIRSIYNFCAQKIRYVAVEYGQAGYEPHPAADIFRNKYGDCKDQAILLVTMLRKAGFDAYPVLIATRDHPNLNEDFPSVMFNHCIAAVYFNGGTVFLDPTAETCPLGDLPVDDQGRKVLIFKDDTYQIADTPLYPASHNLKKQQLRIKVNDDETIAAEKSVFTEGVYNQAQRFWLLYTPPELIQEELKEKLQNICVGGRLLDYQIKDLDNLNAPVGLWYSFRGSEYFTAASNLRITPQLATLDTSLAAKDKRRYPLDLEILYTEETIFDIELPEGFAIKYMPGNVSEDSPWLTLSVQYSSEGNKIYFRQKLEFKKHTISQDDYPSFKALFESLARKIKQRIVIEKVK